MILNALNALYDRLKNDDRYEISKPGFSLQGIAFSIVLDMNGKLIDIADIRVQDGKKMKNRQMQVLGGNKPSGSGLNPTFLWDTSAYLLGFTTDEAKKKRALETFNASRDFHLARESEVNDPDYTAVCNFFREWQPEDFDVAKYPFIEKLVGGYGVFKIASKPCFVHENEKIESYFLKSTLGKTDPDDIIAQSLVSGEIAAIASTQGQIKGIGEKAATLVGFNAKAYESYGKEQAYNAPVTKEENFRYTVALNSLTNGPMQKRHMVNLGDMKVIFWAECDTVMEDMFGNILRSDSAIDQVEQKKLQTFYDYFRNGVLPRVDCDLKVPFYVLGLSANVTRIVVRFFNRSTVGRILDCVKLHYSQMLMQRSFDSDPEFPSIRHILDQTCPLKGAFPDRDKLPANLEGALLSDIISGAKYPAGVYNRILQRFKIDHYQDYIKASFIKAFLIRNTGKEYKVSLDINETNRGYLCGRLFALLVKTQQDVMNDTKSTIRESYAASASARPGSVFPRLLKLYQHHYAKLDNLGQKTFKDCLMQEIMGKLGTTFPASLNYQDQGSFFLGFTQQMQAFFQKKPVETSGSTESVSE